MIKLRIHELARERGIDNLFKHLTDNGFSHAVAARINQGVMKRYPMEYIFKLLVIFKCEPNDLFELDVKPEKRDELLAAYPFLAVLVHGEVGAALGEKLGKLNKKQVGLLSEFLDGLGEA